MDTARRIVIGISGASGAPYAERLLEVLCSEPFKARVELAVVLSATAQEVWDHECAKALGAFDVPVYGGRDYNAPFASGSSAPDAMVIVPASMSTVARVANGISDNLLTRAADVVLKEQKRLILVPRETPYSEVHLKNLLELTRMGALVLPASPSFYGKPQSVRDLLDTVIGRLLDHLGLAHGLTRRWGAPSEQAQREKR
jgi:4-hydroxy-3-polyprenylbenzoate decarboxylase